MTRRGSGVRVPYGPPRKSQVSGLAATPHALVFRSVSNRGEQPGANNAHPCAERLPGVRALAGQSFGRVAALLRVRVGEQSSVWSSSRSEYGMRKPARPTGCRVVQPPKGALDQPSIGPTIGGAGKLRARHLRARRVQRVAVCLRHRVVEKSASRSNSDGSRCNLGRVRVCSCVVDSPGMPHVVWGGGPEGGPPPMAVGYQRRTDCWWRALMRSSAAPGGELPVEGRFRRRSAPCRIDARVSHNGQ